MKSCPICSNQNPDTARFCVKCGWQLTLQGASKVTADLSSPPGDADAGGDAAPPSIDATPPTSPLQHDADTQEFSAQDFLVLVVDDTVDNLVIISLHLQQRGYRVVTATNGEEAVKVASLTNPDLILMDLSMPELDGLGATRKIREHPTLRAVPIVAVTAFSTEGFQRAAFDAGIDGYITKPIDFERMSDLVRSLLPVKRNDEGGTMNDE